MIRVTYKVPLGTHGSDLMLLSRLIKFCRGIIRLNRLSDLLGQAQQKALLKLLIKTFLQKCILNTNATFMDCAVETTVCFM